MLQILCAQRIGWIALEGAISLGEVTLERDGRHGIQKTFDSS